MTSSTFEVRNPATGAVIERVQAATVEDADAAVERAAAAFERWRGVAPSDRARLLRRLAERLDAERERLAQLEMRNAGKPIADARGEIGMVVDTFAYYAGAPERLLGDTIPVAGGIDVTVVLKPAGLTPLTAIELGRLAEEAGIPAGVVNVLPGPGRVVGQRLVEHPRVAKIAFTGSTEVGRGIMRAAAGTIKRVTLELGGKSANVVFADADLEAAAAAAPAAVFGNAGQDCCARSRILVERPALDDFLALLEPAVTGFRVGDPADEATQMGPLISAGQRDTVASYVPEGAPVAVRGAVPDGPGYWYPPTVLAPVAPGDRAVTEEIFGPVAVVLPFADEAEAVRLANDTIYGLSGSVWTRDGARALRMARAIDTGALSVNSNTSVRVTTPFGGFKQSGVGRELGPHALDHYTEVKNVFIAT